MDIAGSDIVKAVEAAQKRVCSLNELAHLLDANRVHWRLAVRTTAADFVKFLERKGLKVVVIEFLHPGRAAAYFCEIHSGMLEHNPHQSKTDGIFIKVPAAGFAVRLRRQNGVPTLARAAFTCERVR
jgi:hypothetical protein